MSQDKPTDANPHEKDPEMTTDMSEQQLRKALGTVNDLEPPRDDLFVQRAVSRGRARTARRRSMLQSAAAGLVIVGAVGGTWALTQQGSSSTSAGSAAAGAPAEASGDDTMGSMGSTGAGTDSGGNATPDAGLPAPGQSLPARGRPSPSASPASPTAGIPSVRDTSPWLRSGPMTPQRMAFDDVATTVAATYPDVFSGAYAADGTNTVIVVAVTRADAGLEALVRGAMPAASDVRFVRAANSLAAKQRVMAAINRDVPRLRGRGVTVISVGMDARKDRVVVVANEGSSPGLIERTYGTGLVDVIATTVGSTGKLPNGATLPPLQR